MTYPLAPLLFTFTVKRSTAILEMILPSHDEPPICKETMLPKKENKKEFDLT